MSEQGEIDRFLIAYNDLASLKPSRVFVEVDSPETAKRLILEFWRHVDPRTAEDLLEKDALLQETTVGGDRTNFFGLRTEVAEPTVLFWGNGLPLSQKAVEWLRTNLQG